MESSICYKLTFSLAMYPQAGLAARYGRGGGTRDLRNTGLNPTATTVGGEIEPIGGEIGSIEGWSADGSTRSEPKSQPRRVASSGSRSNRHIVHPT
jgi:hypothetical protein